MFSARVPKRKPILRFARVSFFFASFGSSSTPMPSRRLGRTDKYDGEAHIKKSFADVLQQVAALRLLPFANSFAVQKRYVVALVTMFKSSGSSGGISAWIVAPFLRCGQFLCPFLLSLLPWSRCFHFRLITCQIEEETFANTNALSTQQLGQSLHFVTSAYLQGRLVPTTSFALRSVSSIDATAKKRLRHVATCVAKFFHLFRATCLLRNQSAP